MKAGPSPAPPLFLPRSPSFSLPLSCFPFPLWSCFPLRGTAASAPATTSSSPCISSGFSVSISRSAATS